MKNEGTKVSRDVLDSFLLELKRGTLVLGVLTQLATPQYGYALVVLLEDKKIPVEAGTLYPLLRRLEKQGVLQSEWETEASKPRKYYQLSQYGKEVYDQLCEEWFGISDHLNRIIRGEV